MSVKGSRNRNVSKKIDFGGIFMGLILKYSQIQIAHSKVSPRAFPQREAAGDPGSGDGLWPCRESPRPQARVPAPTQGWVRCREGR